MISQNIALSNWNNGVIMIAIFAFVCLALVGVVINLMMSDKKKNVSDNLDGSNNLIEEDNKEY